MSLSKKDRLKAKQAAEAADQERDPVLLSPRFPYGMKKFRRGFFRRP